MKRAIATRVRTRHRVIARTLIIDLEGRRRVLSSAPQGGGFRPAAYILNHQVDASSTMTGHVSDPARYLTRLASELGVGRETIGLMTAVPMTQFVTARASVGQLWVECFATVGVTNAVCAGEWPPHGTDRNGRATPGTINLILVTNSSLSNSAMVGAVQVATEAKTGVLRDQKIPSRRGTCIATGTGTDAVVIACRLRRQGPFHVYSGTHTVMGALIGRVVAHCVARGLAKAKAWQNRCS
jgi:adenosylcobinamide hydrolase